MPYLGSASCYIRVCMPLDPVLDINENYFIQHEYQLQPIHDKNKNLSKLRIVSNLLAEEAKLKGNKVAYYPSNNIFYDYNDFTR
jgi:hypothetical protein